MVIELKRFFASFLGSNCTSQNTIQQPVLAHCLPSCEQYQLDELMYNLPEVARECHTELMLEWLIEFANLAAFDDLVFDQALLTKELRTFQKCHKVSDEMRELLQLVVHLSGAHKIQLFHMKERFEEMLTPLLV